VNKSCRESARAFNTLPPQVFHDTVPRNGSPFSSPASPPKTVLPRERKRVKILRELDLLDGTQEESFDRITNLASRIFRCPIAVVSFMDETHQYFKSRLGLPVKKVPRIISFNRLTFLDDRKGVIVVHDTQYQDHLIPLNEIIPLSQLISSLNRSGSCSLPQSKNCNLPSVSDFTQRESVGSPSEDSIKFHNPSVSASPNLGATNSQESSDVAEADAALSPARTLHLSDCSRSEPFSIEETCKMDEEPPFQEVFNELKDEDTDTANKETTEDSEPGSKPSPSPAASSTSPSVEQLEEIDQMEKMAQLQSAIRFFATTSIFAGDVKVGCLSICDTKTHHDFSKQDEAYLLDLAGIISDLLQFRRVARREEEIRMFQAHQDALLRIREPLQVLGSAVDELGRMIHRVFHIQDNPHFVSASDHLLSGSNDAAVLLSPAPRYCRSDSGSSLWSRWDPSLQESSLTGGEGDHYPTGFAPVATASDSDSVFSAPTRANTQALRVPPLPTSGYSHESGMTRSHSDSYSTDCTAATPSIQYPSSVSEEATGLFYPVSARTVATVATSPTNFTQKRPTHQKCQQQQQETWKNDESCSRVDSPRLPMASEQRFKPQAAAAPGTAHHSLMYQPQHWVPEPVTLSHVRIQLAVVQEALHKLEHTIEHMIVKHLQVLWSQWGTAVPTRLP
jgi:hypothetical protein